MPRNFELCVKGGGRVRTIKPGKATYMHVCYPKGGGGKSTHGEVKHVKRKTR